MKYVWKLSLVFMLALLTLCTGAAIAEETLAFPAGLQIIEEEAFFNAAGLTRVVIPEGTTEIGPRAFAGSSVKNILIPASVTSIADDAFQDVAELTVRGRQDSYAQTYCAAHNIRFVAISTEPYPESLHPYENGTDQTWHWTGQPDTKMLRIHFSQCAVEEGYDWLYLYDGSGELMREYTGSLPYQCAVVVPGNSFSIRLVSDEYCNGYGFAIEKIEELTRFAEQPLNIKAIQTPATPTTADFANHQSWTVEAEGTFAPLCYEFTLMHRDASGEEAVCQTEKVYRAYSGITLQEPGTYTMHVTVTDGRGETVSAVADPVVVRFPAPLGISSLSADTTAGTVGKPVQWLAAYENALYPLNVEYVVTRDGAESKRESRTIASAKEDTGYSFVPDEAGAYTLTVNVTDASGASATAASSPVTSEVRWEPAITITSDCASAVIGQPITWTVAVENSSDPWTFYYNVTMHDATLFSGSERADDGRMTYTYTPNEAGDWAFSVSVSVDNNFVRKTSENVRVTKDLGIPEGNFLYKLNDANEALISGYTGTDGYVLIPETIAGFPVVGIADEAFSLYYNYDYVGNSVITEVVIPACVKSIGSSAFYKCPNLHTVDFGTGVSTVGYNAFYGCEKLSKVIYPLSLSADSRYSLFPECPSLKSITVPEGVTVLPKSVFYNVESLENVTLPSTLTTVQSSAFNGCKNLKNVELPDSVTYIGSSAFYNCSSLRGFRYPIGLQTATSIGSNIFVGCTSMSTVIIPEGVTKIVRQAFKGCEGIREVQCPSTLELIDTQAFSECVNLTSIILREGLKTIESGAFNGCTSLKVVDLPNSVETIAGVCFANCTSLEKIHLPTQWKKSGYSIFADSPMLTTIRLPEGLTKLPNDAFVGCNCIEEVYLPASLLEIGEYAFSGCVKLADIHFQEGLRKINAYAFKNCTSLKDADLPDSVEHILENIFQDCTALETFHYPLNWMNTFISSSWPYNIYAGYQVLGCPKITRIVVPEGVTSLPHFVMCGCESIQEVVLPQSLLEIQDGAFKDCINLRKANIPGSVVYIGKEVFENCPLLNISCEWGSAGYLYAINNDFANEYLTLYEGEYPQGKLPIGKSFDFKGTVYAHDKIHSLSAYVYNADGSRLLQGSIATPYDTEAELYSNFNHIFKIEGLPEGRYLFRLSAVVAGAAEQTLVESTFDIAPANDAMLLTSDLVMPEGAFRTGYDFPFAGKITFALDDGDHGLPVEGTLAVRIVEETENRIVRECAFTAGLREVIDLSTVQHSMKFSELDAGMYTYRITGYVSGNPFTVAESHFRISPQEEDLTRTARLDAALLGSSESRSYDLLYESAILANRAYDANQAISNLEALGFQQVAPYSISPGAHTIGHFIGWKDIQDSDGSTTRVYAIICRGTAPFLNEWMSNFTLASPEGYHHGFYQAASEVRRNFHAYVANHTPDPFAPQDYKVWIAGHSRGGAVANILGGAFLPNDGYTRSNVFTYTFACPNVYKGAVPRVSNVFNYNLGGDLVPCVPLESWGYSRYGSTVTLQNGDAAFGVNLTATSDMEKIVEVLSRVGSIDKLEATFNEAMKDLTTYAVDEVWRCYINALFEVLVELNLTKETDNLAELLLMLKDAGSTHASTTYIEWISTITGR